MVDNPPQYQRTLLLDDTGDISFDGGGKLVMTVTDDQKRAQDIMMYMKTVYGEDMFNPKYGFDIMSAKEAPFSSERIKYEVKQAIEQYRNRIGRPDRIKSMNAIMVSEPDADRVVAVGVSLTADTDTVSTLGVNL